MSHLDEWAHLIAKQLKSEAELVSARMKSDLYEDVARETFIRVVLEPFLPGSYAVGSGRVIDSAGSISSPQDIVIYRRDYPQFNMPGSHDVFIYESVLATIQVGSKLVRKSFFNALDQCASLATLNPAIDPSVMRGMAAKMKMQLDTQQQYIHPDPLNTGRFNLIGRPQSFIYAFSGYQTSDRQLAENLSKWIDLYHEHNDVLQMKSLPSVIATQGCFGWRNTTPFAIKSRTLMGVGIDPAPLRLIILQLMHAVNRRLQNTSDGYGIKSNIAPYLDQFEPPAISEMLGTALNPGDKKPTPTHSQAPERVVDKKQTAAAEQVQPDAKRHATEKSARMANLAPAVQAVAPSPVRPTIVEAKGNGGDSAGQKPVESQSAVLAQHKKSSITALSSVNASPTGGAANTGSSGKPGTSTEQQVKSAQIAAGPSPMETEKKDPVIKNLSMPRPTQTDTTAMQSSQGTNRPRPSALSLFSDGTEGDSEEEYQFNPIEPSTHQSNVNGADDESGSDDIGIMSTQANDVTESGDNSSKSEGKLLKGEPLSSLPGQDKGEEVDDSFLDTLVETAESLAQDTSEPSTRKSGYVTESLI